MIWPMNATILQSCVYALNFSKTESAELTINRVISLIPMVINSIIRNITMSGIHRIIRLCDFYEFWSRLFRALARLRECKWLSAIIGICSLDYAKVITILCDGGSLELAQTGPSCAHLESTSESMKSLAHCFTYTKNFITRLRTLPNGVICIQLTNWNLDCLHESLS